MSHENLNHAFDVSGLIIKYLNNSLTVDEEIELNAWLNKAPENRALFEQIISEEQRVRDLKLLNSFNADKALNKLAARINKEDAQQARVVPMKLYYRIVAAAMVLIISVFGIWYLQKSPDYNKTNLAVTKKNKPESNDKIVLKLASGASVDVEAAANGVVSKQGKVTINKEDNRLLSLNTTKGATTDAATESMNNVLWVPKGKQYQLQLPDGSKVWLNAQSSITFPANFSTAERVVELTGEAYFEVEHHDKWPFRVKTAGQLVQVLGTHFNVQAYDDDGKTITTLISGSVRVSKGADKQIIKPGQQALSYADNQKLQVAPADIDAVLDWKNGMLTFNDEKIEDIMRKVSRTYNVDIEVDDAVKDKHFWGRFPAKNGWMNLLRNLEQTNTIHYKVNGRRVIVMP